MGRRHTTRPAYVRGRWVARILLRDGGYVEFVLTRDRRPFKGSCAKDQGWAKRLARHAQDRYDDGTWTPPTQRPAVTTQTTVGEWCDRFIASQTYRNAAKERQSVALHLGSLS